MFKLRLRAPMLAALAMLGGVVYAQDYHVSEDYQPDPATADAGPVRMARISFIQGTVSWRPGNDGDWSAASLNLPIRQGAQVWVSDHSRAEIQFDDGSIARIGSASQNDGGVVTLQTLYSDSKGEFTELSLSSGLIAMHLINGQSLYQIDTQAASAKAYGPASFRVGVGQGVEIVDRTGEVAVENNGTNSLNLEPRDSVYAQDTDTAMTAATAPMEDSFDQWVDTRDEAMTGHAGPLPENIAVCAGNLNSYGSWRGGEEGQVWYPTVAAGWSPYHEGHWVFVRPFGWTWVGDEAWGWAPYHYGTWIHSGYGWGWVPGPAQQCWCPAVVHFSSYNGQVAWCPLAPAEVHYAAIGVNLGSGFSLGFSIGSVGCYYPATNAYCVPRTFNNVQINRVTTVTNVTVINNYYGSTVANSTHFTPRNATFSGASFVAANNFGRGGRAETLSRDSAAFSRGQSLAPQGNRVMSGPPGVQVSHESFTPSHSFSSATPRPSVLNRPILRPNLPSTIDHVSAPSHTQFIAPRPSNGIPNRPTNSVRPTTPNRPSSGFSNQGFGNRSSSGQISRSTNPSTFSRPTSPARNNSLFNSNSSFNRPPTSNRSGNYGQRPTTPSNNRWSSAPSSSQRSSNGFGGSRPSSSSQNQRSNSSFGGSRPSSPSQNQSRPSRSSSGSQRSSSQSRSRSNSSNKKDNKKDGH